MAESRPLILIVNDDGYEAKGLEAMVSIAKPLGEVAVVVPDRTRSGMGHAITMGEPLRLTNYKNEDGVAYYKTNGTPVDCVKLGEKVVLRDRKIDLVLSGINHGLNTGVNTVYSGTMGLHRCGPLRPSDCGKGAGKGSSAPYLPERQLSESAGGRNQGHPHHATVPRYLA